MFAGEEKDSFDEAKIAEDERLRAALEPTLADFPLLACGTNGRGHMGQDHEVAGKTAIPLAEAIRFFKKDFRVGSVTCAGDICMVTHQSTGELLVCNCGDKNPHAKFETMGMDGLFIASTASTNTTRYLLTGQRQVYVWGNNVYGQLGRNEFDETMSLRKPKLVRGISSFRVKEIAAGRYHVLALTNAGVIFAWGRNNAGQLGLGDRKNRSQPCSIDVLDGCNVSRIAAGPETSAAVGDTKIGRLMGKHINAKTEKRLLLTWGRADEHRLGHTRRDGDAFDLDDEDEEEYEEEEDRDSNTNDPSGESNTEESKTVESLPPKTLKPNAPAVLVPGMSRPHYVPVVAAMRELPEQPALGEGHGVCRLSSGQCVAWGCNQYGQLGLGHMYNEHEPVLIEALANIIDVKTGPHHTAFLSSPGVVYTTGFNHYGELGLGDKQMRLTPAPMMHLASEGVKPQGLQTGNFMTFMWTIVAEPDASLSFQEDLRQRQCRLSGNPRAPETVERCAPSDGFAYIALAGPAVSKGSYTWTVRIDKMTSGDSALGVGVAGAEAMDPFIFDNFDQGMSWLFMSNGEKMHDSTIEEYSEPFYERDTIGVHLDVELGTLRFSRRGNDLGLGFYLTATEPLFLCVSMPSEGDKVTLLPPEDDEVSGLQDPGTLVCYNDEGVHKTTGIEVFYECGPCGVLLCRACVRHCSHRQHRCELYVNNRAAHQHCECDPVLCQAKKLLF